MLSRSAKATFYFFAGPIMKANGWLYRMLRATREAGLRVQLGPGQRNYIAGWINVDANMFTARCDVWADLRNPLPFHDGTVEAMYSHHVIEHLPDLDFHFRDVYRCLQPGGIYRCGGPNAASAIQKYIENDEAWFGDFPVRRKSIGGRLENFIFCQREHLTLLTYSFLEELMAGAGFRSITSCLPVKETNYPRVFCKCLEKEHESHYECPHTLIVECEKPIE